MPELDLLTPEILAALKLESFVALDVETTGLRPESDDIIELAAVRFRNGAVEDRLVTLLKPAIPIPEFITQLTGISNETVREAPTFAEKLGEVRDFIGSAPIVAHSAGFDLGFLEYHARRVKSDFSGWSGKEKEFRYFPNPVIDTLLLGRIFFPFLPSFALENLAGSFDISLPEAHRAGPDAEVCGQLLLAMLPTIVKTRLADAKKLHEIAAPAGEHVAGFLETLTLFLASGQFHIPEGIDRTAFDINANFYNIIGEDVLHREGDESAYIDRQEIENFFGEEGTLARKFGVFEVRGPQVDMAGTIADGFNSDQLLAVEAGTGTGKSLAYLVPAIEWATSRPMEEGRVVISTNTKNLQEQLFFKDLPVLNSIAKRPFKAVLLKGKGNYLCLDKWATVMHDTGSRLNAGERAQMLPLYFWAQQTETGDISENGGFRSERNPGLWSKFIAENNYCPGRNCRYYDRCFLMRARNNAKTAHLVLVNHSLLFSDLAADNAILGEYRHLIVDEAHNMEKTATEYLGVESTIWQFRDLFRKIYSKERFPTGILVQLRKQSQKSDMPSNTVDTLDRFVESLIELLVPAAAESQVFFRELTRFLREKSQGVSDQRSFRKRYIAAPVFFESLMPDFENFHGLLKKCRKVLNDLIEYLRELPEESFEYQRQIFLDLTAQQAQEESITANLEFLLTSEWDNFVYWYELPSREDSDDTRLYAAPLDVGAVLNEKLYARLKSAVFTSATLAIRSDFNYFLNRVGLHYAPSERLATRLLDSPFNYQEQVMLLVPSFLNDPGQFRYVEQLRDLLNLLFVENPRGTLTLFTSYAMLRQVYQELKPAFAERRQTLLGQGMDGTRQNLIRRFREDGQGLLLGTDSFWEGVDVPGKALEQVLITKLPFEVPSDPVFQARSELIKKLGGNPFVDYALPEAVIRFRQGFGRLIRNQSDFGAVLILDNRVIRKFYGKVFLNALPVEPILAASPAEISEHLRRWFS